MKVCNNTAAYDRVTQIQSHCGSLIYDGKPFKKLFRFNCYNVKLGKRVCIYIYLYKIKYIKSNDNGPLGSYKNVQLLSIFFSISIMVGSYIFLQPNYMN